MGNDLLPSETVNPSFEDYRRPDSPHLSEGVHKASCDFSQCGASKAYRYPILWAQKPLPSSAEKQSEVDQNWILLLFPQIKFLMRI